MELSRLQDSLKPLIRKYRPLIIAVLVGILLMSVPTKKETTELKPASTEPTVTQTDKLQKDLELLLSQMQGAGTVRVLLTEAKGEEVRYQYDEEQSESNKQRKTVLAKNAGHEESGIIRQVIPPIYQGAIILCQGGDSPAVQLAITEAVSNVTGLTADKVKVLKMQ